MGCFKNADAHALPHLGLVRISGWNPRVGIEGRNATGDPKVQLMLRTTAIEFVNLLLKKKAKNPTKYKEMNKI